VSQVIGFFSQRLEQAGSDLSVERVQEVIKKGAVALPKDRLKVSTSNELSFWRQRPCRSFSTSSPT